MGRVLQDFAFLPRDDYGRKLKLLSDMAEPEDWDFNIKNEELDCQVNSSSQSYPILRSYLRYTFQRLDEEQKILYDTENEHSAEHACFNTGLLARETGEPIFGLFQVNGNYRQDPSRKLLKWHLSGFFQRSDQSFTKKFSGLPQVARYVNFQNVEDFSNYVYNPELEVKMPPLSYYEDHILGQRRSRFPEEFQEIPDRFKKMVFDQALQNAVDLARQSNRIALPQWRPKQQQLQILLPLYLEENKLEASVALPIQTQGNLYIVRTVLSLDLAYNNARLLSKFYSNWLQPIQSDDENEELLDTEEY
jgi:hypothetical protein